MNQMTTIRRTIGRLLLPTGVHWWLFLCYLALLPVAGTIALRNVLLALLALQSAVFLLARAEESQPQAPGQVFPPLMWVWIAYVAISPLFAGDPLVAWREFRGQWIESLLAWIVTFVAIARAGLTSERLFSIAMASAVYPALYIAMFVWAWLGGFGTPSSIGDMPPWTVLVTAIGGVAQIGWPSWAGIPWGFRGFDPIHANLGIACAHTGIALMAYGILRWRAGLGVRLLPSVLLASVVILPPFLSNSRASIIFVAMSALLGLIAVWLLNRRARQHPVSGSWIVRAFPAGLTLVLVAAIGALALKVYKDDARWQAIYQKALVGFIIPDPVGVVCSGYTADLEMGLRHQLAGHPAEKVDQILAQVHSGIESVAHMVDGDLGRVLMARSGWELVRENPFGLDGSRGAYKRLIREKCGRVPYIEYAHSHQGWIDLALALGWAGATIYLGLLLYLAGIASISLARGGGTGWAIGLAMLCLFWVFRGLFDSVYREHYLQMQAVMLGVFWNAMRINARSETLYEPAQDKVS